jgi:predicted methyltransferase
MTRPTILSTLAPSLLLTIVTACGSAPPPQPASAPAPVPSSAAPLAEVPAAAPAEPPKPAEPTPEEKKKAEEAQRLQQDRAKAEEDMKAESARWTPEMHAAAKALAEKAYPSGHAAIQAAVAGKHRKPGNAERDKYRHPIETLDFAGLKPTMTVLEIAPGEGWYTELLAPALAKKGKLLVTTSDPNGPADQRSTLSGQRFKGFLDTSPELYGNVGTIVVDYKAPKLGLDSTVDLVLLMRELHGFENSGTLKAWLDEIHKALKPNGVLEIEEHRAKAEANPEESSKKGYVPEKWAILQIEAAGFKLAGKSEINANPKDTKDYAEGVWTLPPSFRLKDKDHDKYAAIGESDRMTLKFVKVTAPAAAAPKTAPKQ